MSLIHRPLCALFGGHDFEVIRGLVVCSYCGYVAKPQAPPKPPERPA